MQKMPTLIEVYQISSVKYITSPFNNTTAKPNRIERAVETLNANPAN